MTPHEYAVIGHKRSEVGRWIGLASIMAAPLITYPLTLASQLSFLSESLQAKLATFTLSTGFVYLVLYWIFNKYGWRWLNKLLDIPDLSGKWQVHGVTLEQKGEVPSEWQREMTISQKWDRMAIELHSGPSSSYSESASILVKHNNETRLSYSYQNHPRPGEPDLYKHQGFCELVFDPDCRSAEGHYVNSQGRHTYGKLILKKIES